MGLSLCAIPLHPLTSRPALRDQSLAPSNRRSSAGGGCSTPSSRTSTSVASDSAWRTTSPAKRCTTVRAAIPGRIRFAPAAAAADRCGAVSDPSGSIGHTTPHHGTRWLTGIRSLALPAEHPDEPGDEAFGGGARAVEESRLDGQAVGKARVLLPRQPGVKNRLRLFRVAKRRSQLSGRASRVLRMTNQEIIGFDGGLYR